MECRCRRCGALHDDTRRAASGYCSVACQHLMAREVGYDGELGTVAELDALSAAGVLGLVPTPAGAAERDARWAAVDRLADAMRRMAPSDREAVLDELRAVHDDMVQRGV